MPPKGAVIDDETLDNDRGLSARYRVPHWNYLDLEPPLGPPPPAPKRGGRGRGRGRDKGAGAKVVAREATKPMNHHLISCFLFILKLFYRPSKSTDPYRSGWLDDVCRRSLVRQQRLPLLPLLRYFVRSCSSPQAVSMYTFTIGFWINCSLLFLSCIPKTPQQFIRKTKTRNTTCVW